MLRVLVLPSWYLKYGGDLGGSFFREQAQALARSIKIQVLAPLSYSYKNYWDYLKAPGGIRTFKDGDVTTWTHKVLALPNVIPYGSARTFVRRGIKMYKEYIKLNPPPTCFMFIPCLTPVSWPGRSKTVTGCLSS